MLFAVQIGKPFETWLDLTETSCLVSSQGGYNKAMFCARRMTKSALKSKCLHSADVAIITILKPSQHLRQHREADPARIGALKTRLSPH